ncbi:uncharacterized protein [Aegilops tauschii subsp. strangulata]|uniref:uncharacterized protein n=1 Tax=Aegilops tauschii subsp. strangulata TaxID=200361 RepID=UPI00098B7903|nr:uncharacterized protein LOC109770918 [Aegilops tauschii subsp. strangulata]
MSSGFTINSNPFADANPPDITDIRNLKIYERVPVRLSQTDSSYYAWKTYFSLVFREYHLIDHVDGSVDSGLIPDIHEWSTIDTTLIRWFFLTISPDPFQTVVKDGDEAQAVWTKLNRLFTDNRLKRLAFLQQEVFGCHRDNSSVDNYCRRLKTLADELCNIGAKIDDDLLLSTLSANLNEDFGNAAANLTLILEPSFAKFVAYLRLEERRMKQVKARAIHTALAAGTTRRGPPDPPLLRSRPLSRATRRSTAAEAAATTAASPAEL